MLHPHLSPQHEARARLAREARAVARLQHPNILEVFDFADPASEEAFLVTELVRGVTLKTFVEPRSSGRRSWRRWWWQQLARALGHAHEAGVIHRDLKPENVMVRDDGVLKLMDFGIARVLDPGERMTVTGALVGSPAYMAPEVIDGQPATAESDVFSLGTLLYWLCTGLLPFQAASTQATLKRILDGTFDDPRGPCPALSDGLAAIIARCLERDPSRRYSNAQGLATALATELDTLGFTDVRGGPGVLLRRSRERPGAAPRATPGRADRRRRRRRRGGQYSPGAEPAQPAARPGPGGPARRRARQRLRSGERRQRLRRRQIRSAAAGRGGGGRRGVPRAGRWSPAASARRRPARRRSSPRRPRRRHAAPPDRPWPAVPEAATAERHPGRAPGPLGRDRAAPGAARPGALPDPGPALRVAPGGRRQADRRGAGGARDPASSPGITSCG